MRNISPQILVVEDDPDIALMIAFLLEDIGYKVDTKDGGNWQDGLNKDALPELILLDMLLSGVDGRDIVRQLKSQPSTHHIPILMVSAHPSAQREAKLAGADDFLAKPFDMDELLARVAKYLA
jgi:DNA-binding response OmpR family regulator